VRRDGFADNPPVSGSLQSVTAKYVSDLMVKEDQSAHSIRQYEKGEHDAHDTSATQHISIATAINSMTLNEIVILFTLFHSPFIKVACHFFTAINRLFQVQLHSPHITSNYVIAKTA